MRNDVTQRCRVCAQTKSEQRKPAGLMVSNPVPTKPWETISTDLVGPLPRTPKGYRFILVVMDCFSKFPLVFPLKMTIH